MRTSELCRLNNLYDPIRKRLVRGTAEEKVRQALLQKMLHQLGYPKGLIVVEQQLSGLKRRFDLLVYSQAMTPLLMIECKADRCTERAREQLFGYNNKILAPFLCMAWSGGEETLWREEESIKSVPFLPNYIAILEAFQKSGEG